MADNNKEQYGFDFDAKSRNKIHGQLQSKLEEFYENTHQQKVSANWDIDAIRTYTQKLSFTETHAPEEVIDYVIKGLKEFAVHTPHPSYYGLFNPRPHFAGILADLITATFNPQMAAWSHAPFANEIERLLIKQFGNKMGYPNHTIDGTFCSGGAESNLTAIICALNYFYPTYKEHGIMELSKRPIIYCSSESHHSIVKAAEITGLGGTSVRSIPVHQDLKMDFDSLKNQIQTDKKQGFQPMMLVATAGTTGAGAIDPLDALADIANEEQLWFHVDAAYGGALAVSTQYKSYLSGIERSHSITLDLHKWFSAPMGISLFLTSQPRILHHSFSIKTKYMPKDGDPYQVIDPYLHSVQWSRRFMGLKIYLPLAIHGWQMFEATIDHQIHLGNFLRTQLMKSGWEILNDTILPIVCFSQPRFSENDIEKMVQRVNDSGKAWLSTYPIGNRLAGRLCLTNYKTTHQEIENLLEQINSYHI